jgi:hypothetical protein
MNDNIEKTLIRWSNKSDEFSTRIAEEWNLLQNIKALEDLYRLKKEGHLLIPAYRDIGGSFVLYTLGLNPINPLEIKLPILPTFYPTRKEKNPEIIFYSNSSALPSPGNVQLESLTVLDELKIVLEYLNLSLDELNEIVKQNTDLTPFLIFLQAKQKDVVLPYFLNLKMIKQLQTQTSKDPVNLAELANLVHQNFTKNNPKTITDKYLIAEIYMDILLLTWKWWIGTCKESNLIA